MKSGVFLLLLFLMTVSSCNKNKIYEKFDKGFPDNRWSKSTIKTYDFTIKDASKNYALTLNFSHLQGYQFTTIPVQIEIKNPDGTIDTKAFNFEIVDKEGKDTGDCAGDYCDVD